MKTTLLFIFAVVVPAFVLAAPFNLNKQPNIVYNEYTITGDNQKVSPYTSSSICNANTEDPSQYFEAAGTVYSKKPVSTAHVEVSRSKSGRVQMGGMQYNYIQSEEVIFKWPLTLGIHDCGSWLQYDEEILQKLTDEGLTAGECLRPWIGPFSDFYSPLGPVFQWESMFTQGDDQIYTFVAGERATTAVNAAVYETDQGLAYSTWKVLVNPDDHSEIYAIIPGTAGQGDVPTAFEIETRAATPQDLLGFEEGTEYFERCAEFGTWALSGLSAAAGGLIGVGSMAGVYSSRSSKKSVVKKQLVKVEAGDADVDQNDDDSVAVPLKKMKKRRSTSSKRSNRSKNSKSSNKA